MFNVMRSNVSSISGEYISIIISLIKIEKSMPFSCRTSSGIVHNILCPRLLFLNKMIILKCKPVSKGIFH